MAYTSLQPSISKEFEHPPEATTTGCAVIFLELSAGLIRTLVISARLITPERPSRAYKCESNVLAADTSDRRSSQVALFFIMLKVFSIISLFTLYAVGTAANINPAPDSTLERRSISQDLLDQLTRFTNFSSAAYQATCPSPLGTTLVQAFSNTTSDTQGYVTRDDTNKQIIVAFRGSQQLQDFLTDAEILLTPFVSQGVSDTNNATAHTGFLGAYNSVASTVLSTVSSQLDAHPDYSLISTGHSLGAAIASIGGVSLASNFPGTPLQVFTFGQPRTGDPAYAQLAENLVGAGNIFRAVHTTDGVPTIIPQAIGYQHHETEYWNFQDPSTADNVKQCSGEEDSTCSDSIPSMGIDAAHLTYFGQAISLDPSVCQ